MRGGREGGERHPLRFKTMVTYFDNVASIVHWSQNTDTLERAPMLQAKLWPALAVCCACISFYLTFCSKIEGSFPSYKSGNLLY